MATTENPLVSSSANGHSPSNDVLYALSDEQILEIEPEAQVVSGQSSVVGEEPVPTGLTPPADSSLTPRAGEPRVAPTPTTPTAQGASHDAPPKWLADILADPQTGGEARDFWNGMQQARQEAAAYREVFAKPEEARAAADRSRQLAEVDKLYFAGDTATREQLAQTLLQQDPAAFREMVFAGLRALEKANVAPPFRAASTDTSEQANNAGLKPGVTTSNPETHLAAYAAFEKAANDDLEREVGGSIARTLEQALPHTANSENAPVRERLSAAVRQDIEAKLKSDRQLGDQVAQILAGRQFNDASRAQVVRLIGERAKQLVPGAAQRVLNDWTQTALGAHRARTQKTDSAAARRDVEGVSSVPAGPRSKSSPPRTGGVDYRKLSDEQILDL